MAPDSHGDSTYDSDLAGDEPVDKDRSRMSFLEHLDELRRRLLYSLYALIASCAVTLWFMAKLNQYLLHYFSTLAGGPLLSTQLSEAFMFQFKIGLFSGLILASPFIFCQLWLFVAPGLYAKEKKVVIPFVLTASLLFGTGVWFNHRLAFPSMVQFFSTFATEDLKLMFGLSGMLSFYVKMALGLGLVFEMPMLTFFLARFGVVTAGFLLRKIKYAVMIIIVLAAVLTPTPDIASQIMFAVPMMGLYVISIGVAWVFGKKKPKPA